MSTSMPPPGPWACLSYPAHNVHPLLLSAFHALEIGDLDLANSHSSSSIPTLPAFLISDSNRAIWRRRLDQITGHQGEQIPWLSRVIVYSPPASVEENAMLYLDDQNRNISSDQHKMSKPNSVIVGRIGFHGPPSSNGTVEVGYETSPEHRNQGHAKAAMQIFVDVARGMESVKILRACVAPENAASRRVVESAGLRIVGREIHDRRGVEDVYELNVCGNDSGSC
ncbi:acyl-CoA N-acyltransferase [Tricladium varicosporioides]|nr:acyl-CoA N-acyltransferase [Hymenoscyphus varicosporioides]